MLLVYEISSNLSNAIITKTNPDNSIIRLKIPKSFRKKFLIQIENIEIEISIKKNGLFTWDESFSINGKDSIIAKHKSALGCDYEVTNGQETLFHIQHSGHYEFSYTIVDKMYEEVAYISDSMASRNTKGFGLDLNIERYSSSMLNTYLTSNEILSSIIALGMWIYLKHPSSAIPHSS